MYCPHTLAHFLEKCKKVHNEVTRTEKHSFWLIYLNYSFKLFNIILRHVVTGRNVKLFLWLSLRFCHFNVIL